MTGFITNLVVSQTRNGEWLTQAPFVVESNLVGIIEIPAGFAFDANSLPRLAWIVSVPTDYMESGCIHDFLYRHCPDRKLADDVYAEFLAFQGMGEIRRAVRYTALRLFGGPAYRRARFERQVSR